MAVIRDVTEQKQSRERFFKAFYTNPSMMVIMSAPDKIYIDVNASFAQAVGLDRERIIGRSADEINFWFDMAEKQEVMSRLFKEGKLCNCEVRYRSGLKEPGIALLTASKITLADEKCFFQVFTDITDKKRLEKEVARFERLNIVGEMAASIGHEVRNPMTTVRGYLQFFQQKREFAKYSGQFDTMITELDRANSIITEFLSLARDKAVIMKSGNLNRVIYTLYPLLQADAFRMGHEIQLDLGGIPDNKFEDKEIRQLILNLVCNGLEAMNHSGLSKLKPFTIVNG